MSEELKEVLEDLGTIRKLELEEREKDRKMRFKRFLLSGTGLMLFFLIQSGFTWYFLFAPESKPDNDYVSLVRVEGEIDQSKPASALVVNPALRNAFEDEDSKGVVILINSPGGSPVQSGLIRDRIIQLRKKFPEKKVIAIAEDMLTSGSYLISTGVDQIYVQPTTMVGSIGVIMQSFGFSEVIDKIGVERRVIIAGNSKSQMDPFKPLNEADKVRMEKLLKVTHNYFIDRVKESRGDRLNVEYKGIFSGEFWMGEKAVELGLVDGISDLSTILEKEFKVEEVKDYTPAVNIFNSISKMGSKVSANNMLDHFTKIQIELK